MNGDVLVIEDELNIRTLIGLFLDAGQVPYRLAGDGPEGLEEARAAWPAVVLLDLTLPGDLDGWGVWERLAAMADGRPLRVVVFSAATSARSIEAARRRGAAGVLTKPVRADRVLGAIRRATTEAACGE